MNSSQDFSLQYAPEYCNASVSVSWIPKLDMYQWTMLNHEFILNGSRSFPAPVLKNRAGHLGRLLPSGRTDIAACCGHGGGEGSGAGGGAESGLGFVEDGGLEDASSAGPG